MLQTISPDLLLPFITTVINGSLTYGHVPTAFKKARVIPILKKPALDLSDISNYRPNNLHDPNQSGFKAEHSTETALLAVTEQLHAARSAKLSSVLILLDLSAAFDTVNHKTLLSTLRSLGICGTAWEWFVSYLDGHSYQVTWKGMTSASCRLSTGVPQGSVLGPLLFSLYTHFLGKVISSHGFSYHCYTDDSQLIFSFPPSDTTASARISACLVDISFWMTAHQLKHNPSKTELLVIPAPGSLPPFGGFQPSRAEVVARLCCSAVDVARRWTSLGPPARRWTSLGGGRRSALLLGGGRRSALLLGGGRRSALLLGGGRCSVLLLGCGCRLGPSGLTAVPVAPPTCLALLLAPPTYLTMVLAPFTCLALLLAPPTCLAWSLTPPRVLTEDSFGTMGR
ncbi:hypothetical protein QTP86_029921, partial [Hemibagrus guttatus]